MSTIGYLRIYPDKEGYSNFEKRYVELETKGYASPAPSLNTSKQGSADNSFLVLPSGWYGDWHPNPARQWLILMTGKCEFEAGDGERIICKVGDIVLLDDTTGKGHLIKVIGEEAVRIAAIHFS